MALGITIAEHYYAGNKRCVRGTIAFDSSYVTGGESLVARDIGLGAIDHISVEPRDGFVFEYDFTNKKLLAFVPGVEVDAAGAATMDDFALTAGKAASARSVSLDNAAGAGVHRLGKMKEVANTVDLSAVTGVRFRAEGV